MALRSLENETEQWLAMRLAEQGLDALSLDELSVAYSSSGFSSAWRSVTGEELSEDLRRRMAERVGSQRLVQLGGGGDIEALLGMMVTVRYRGCSFTPGFFSTLPRGTCPPLEPFSRR